MADLKLGARQTGTVVGIQPTGRGKGAFLELEDGTLVYITKKQSRFYGDLISKTSIAWRTANGFIDAAGVFKPYKRGERNNFVSFLTAPERDILGIGDTDED